MKNTQKCPKCNSLEILKIPGQVGAHGSGNCIIVGLTTFSAVKVSRYLCASCGYSEEWIDKKSDLETLKKKFKDS